MAISVEKILTISAKDWFEMMETPAKAYKPVGVHYSTISGTGEVKDINKEFAKIVPDEADVVVNYYVFGERYAYGTALIPKREDSRGFQG